MADMLERLWSLIESKGARRGDPSTWEPGPWQLDHPFVQGRRITGLNMFLFVDHVKPRGGGTAVVRSSPQLIERFVRATGTKELLAMKTAQIKRRFLGLHPYFSELRGKPQRPDRTDRLMRSDTDVEGTPLRVVELTGEPGDVVLCHPRLLHTGAPNTADRPRLMRASRLYRKDFYERYLRGSRDED